MEIGWISYGDGPSVKKGSHRNSDCLREIYSVLPALALIKVTYLRPPPPEPPESPPESPELPPESLDPPESLEPPPESLDPPELFEPPESPLESLEPPELSELPESLEPPSASLDPPELSEPPELLPPSPDPPELSEFPPGCGVTVGAPYWLASPVGVHVASGLPPGWPEPGWVGCGP